MNQYLATFHTHLSAMLTCRALTARGVDARMAPVPRRVSSSCGTGVFYRAQDPCEDCLDEDTDCVYLQQKEQFSLLFAHSDA